MTDALEPKVIAPIVFAASGALFVLLGEVLLARAPGSGRSHGPLLSGIAGASLLLAGYAAATAFADGTNAVFDSRHPMLRLDAFSSYATAVIALGALFSVGLAVVYLKALHIEYGEFYALLLLAAVGLFAAVSAVDLIAIFVGLELANLCVYSLAGFDRTRLRSNEAGLKFLLLGWFASAVLLYGIALLYGAAGTTQLAALAMAFDAGNPLFVVGLGLVVSGLAFKAAAVPFHRWAPDVYQGAPTVVVAFLSASVTMAAFALLLRFAAQAVPAGTELLGTLLQALAILSMIVGNLMALIQTNVKRMLGYAGVAHTGYLLVGVASGTPAGHAAALLYLLLYAFMTLGVFGVLVTLAQGGRECEEFGDLDGLARRRPALAAGMTLFAIALAGVPGTAGFIGKFQLVFAAVEAGLLPLAFVAVLTSVVSVVYYLRLPVAMYMREERDQPPAHLHGPGMGLGEQVVLCACAGAVLLLGVFPNGSWFPALEWAARAAGALAPLSR